MPATSYLPRNRLDALVDGILAITMTLLVFGLKLPDDIHGDLFGALGTLRLRIPMKPDGDSEN